MQSSVFQIFSLKKHISWKIHTCYLFTKFRETRINLINQAVCKIFIGIHAHNPFRIQPQIVDSPLHLLSLINIVMLHHRSLQALCNLLCPISRMAVNDIYLIRYASRIPNTPLNMQRFIISQYDN